MLSSRDAGSFLLFPRSPRVLQVAVLSARSEGQIPSNNKPNLCGLTKSYLASCHTTKNKVDYQVTVAFGTNELKLVLEKLDTVKLEILRLRAMLMPEEEATDEEKKQLNQAKKEMEKGQKTKFEDLVKELGC